MYMPGDPGPSGFADVAADVEGGGAVLGAQNGKGALDETHELIENRRLETLEGGLMGVRDDHHVAVGVGVPVQDDEGQWTPVHDQVVRAVRLRQPVAEQTTLFFCRVLQVIHAPGSPEVFHPLAGDCIRDAATIRDGMDPAAASTIAGMLDELRIQASLPIGGLGLPLHVLQTVGSTNDYAARLARRGAPHGTLVVAEEQTAGRGRRGRRWLTPAGSGLAISLVLRPGDVSPISPAAWNTLGALAVAEALRGMGGEASVKWPNDVLLGGRKVSGVLAEAAWKGEALEYLILGVGVNVLSGSVPPGGELEFPATSVEAEIGRPVDRHELLARIVWELAAWAPKTASDDWRRAVDERLAYRGQWVHVADESGEVRGRILGMAADGRLILDTGEGEPRHVGAGAATVRLIDSAAQ